MDRPLTKRQREYLLGRLRGVYPYWLGSTRSRRLLTERSLIRRGLLGPDRELTDAGRAEAQRLADAAKKGGA